MWRFPAGRSTDPLHDLPAWRIEAHLTHLPVRDTQLYRIALTSPSALPPELKVKGLSTARHVHAFVCLQV